MKKNVRRLYLEQKIKKLDDQIDDALNKNHFLVAQDLENQLSRLEYDLLDTYTDRELHDLYKEGNPLYY